MLLTVHYVWAFLMCFEIHGACFQTMLFPVEQHWLAGWNRSAALLPSPPKSVFGFIVAWINTANGMWHPPSLLRTASCRNWRHAHPAGNRCQCFLLKCKCLWWQCWCRYSVRVTWTYLLVPTFTGKEVSAHHCLCCGSMVSSCQS